MGIVGEMIEDMDATHIPKGKRKNIAYRLQRGEIVLPSYEIRKKKIGGKIIPNYGFDIFMEPDLVLSANRFVRMDTKNAKVGLEADLADVVNATFKNTIDQDGARLGLTTLNAIAYMKMLDQIMRHANLSGKQTLETLGRLRRINVPLQNDIVSELKKRFTDEFNTSMLENAFNNHFLYVTPEVAFEKHRPLTQKIKEGIDTIIKEYFADKKNFGLISQDEDIMDHLNSMIPRRARETEEAYLLRMTEEKVASKTEEKVASQVISPFIAGALFKSDEFREFLAKRSKALKISTWFDDGKVKREYEKYIRLLQRAVITRHIAGKIDFSPKDLVSKLIDDNKNFVPVTTEINFGPERISTLNKTSAMIGFDMIRSTAHKDALGGYWFKYLSALKEFFFVGTVGMYGARYLNDMGDGQFYDDYSVIQSVLATYALASEYKSQKVRDDLVARTFADIPIHERKIAIWKKELDTINEHYIKTGLKGIAEAKMESLTDRIKKEADEAILAKKKREILLKDFPAMRLTITHGDYSLPRSQYETATGDAAYQLARALSSDGKPAGDLDVEIVYVDGKPRARHEGIIMTGNAYSVLEEELGKENFVVDDDRTRMLKFRTGNAETKVCALKGLTYNEEQIYIASIGIADLKDYPQSKIYQILTKRESDLLGKKIEVAPPSAGSLNDILGLPPLDSKLQL